MFTVHRQDNNQFTILCSFTEQRTLKSHFLYTIRNLSLSDVAQYMLGRGEEDTAGEIETIFRLTNLDRVYVSDTGKISAVSPL